MTTTTAIAPQAAETAWVCDECAGDGQLVFVPGEAIEAGASEA